MKITWFGHAAFRLDFADKVLLFDPFFTGNPAFVSDKAKAAEGVTHILLTHGHGDHIGDTVSIVKAAEAAGRTVKVVANPEVCAHLGGEGLSAFEMMNTGGTVEMGGFSATFVRADHSSGGGGPNPTYLGNPNGIIVKAPGEPTVWHLGDTDLFSDMALISEIHGPDVAFVPIGDRFTMGPATAALAVKRFISAKTVVPCHYATFGLLIQDPAPFVDALKECPVQVIIPPKGEAFTA